MFTLFVTRRVPWLFLVLRNRNRLLATGCILLAVNLVQASAQSATQETSPAKQSTDDANFDFDPEFTQLFDHGRFPNVIVATDGSVLAVWGQTNLQVRRSTDGGNSWGPPQTVSTSPVIHSGGAIVDETNGTLWIFAEASHPPAQRLAFRSDDHGQSWQSVAPIINDDRQGRTASLHMNEHGLTLKAGKHAGRLIRPTRFYGQGNDRQYWPTHFTNAIYSDDQGQTWNTSDAFPFSGTGEAAIVELADGSLYYNSRRHWAPAGENPRVRWTARSVDGGQSWIEGQSCPELPDGPQDSDYGLMAGLVRCPDPHRDILIYSNVDSPAGRKNGTLWVSTDGGKTWPLKRQIVPGPFAYSSLAVGRPGTPSENWIYLFYEGNPQDKEKPTGGTMARFKVVGTLRVPQSSRHAPRATR